MKYIASTSAHAASTAARSRRPVASRSAALAAVLVFAGLFGTIALLVAVPDPTGGQLQAVVTALGIAVAVALARVVG